MTWDDGEPAMGAVYSPKLEQLLGPARRTTGESLEPGMKRLAASLQVVHEEAVFHVLNRTCTSARAWRTCVWPAAVP